MESSTGPAAIRARPVDTVRKLAGLLTGSFLWSIGRSIHVAVAAWLVYQLTDSATMVGVLVAFQYLPVVTLTIPAGVVVDRVDRRRLYLSMQTSTMLLELGLASVTWAGWVSVPILIAVSIGKGVVTAFTGPAWLSMIGSLVRREELLLASSLYSFGFHFAESFGPLVGTALLTRAGAGTAFFVSAALNLPLIFAVCRVRGTSTEPKKGSVRESVGELTRFLHSSRRARLLLPAGAAVAAVALGLPAVLPAYASTALEGGARVYGRLLGSFGAGSLAGAAFLALGSTRFKNRSLVAGGGLVAGAAIAVLSFTGSTGAAVVAGVAAGAGHLVVLITARTVIQNDAPNALHGRVLSAWSMVTLGLGPLGGVLLGWLADAQGVRFAVRLAGGYSLTVGLLFVLAVSFHSWRDRRAARVKPDLQASGRGGGDSGRQI